MKESTASTIPQNISKFPVQDYTPKPKLLMVAIDKEVSLPIRYAFGKDCTLFETARSEEAIFLTRFESIDIAVLSTGETPDKVKGKLDLILSLIGYRKNIAIVLLTDAPFRESLRTYLECGIINHITTIADRHELINKIAHLLGKTNWNANLEPPHPAHLEEHPSPTINELNRVLKSLITELAHKIKNPLVSIKTFTELLDERFDDLNFRKEFYPLVKKEIEKIDRTIESLLEYSEQMQSQTRAVDFLLLLQNQVKTFDQEKRGGIVLSLPEQGLPKVLVDESQCRYALNLLFNTLLKDGENQGMIHVALRRFPKNALPETASLEVTLTLPISGSHLLQSLELILARWIFECFHGKIEEGTFHGQPVLRLLLTPSDKRTPTETQPIQLKLSQDRRQQRFPIVFLDRRKRGRRQTTLPLLFQDRRKPVNRSLEN